MADAPITGRCLCGGVRFEIDAPLGPANYCHCTRCQRRTGTGSSAQAHFEPEALRIVAGADLVKEYQPERGWSKLFCSNCGSALFSRNPEDPGPRSVRLGVLDGDPGVRPSYHQFVAYAAPWEPLPDDGLPRHEESGRRPSHGDVR